MFSLFTDISQCCVSGRHQDSHKVFLVPETLSRRVWATLTSGETTTNHNKPWIVYIILCYSADVSCVYPNLWTVGRRKKRGLENPDRRFMPCSRCHMTKMPRVWTCLFYNIWLIAKVATLYSLTLYWSEKNINQVNIQTHWDLVSGIPEKLWSVIRVNSLELLS